VLHQCVERSRRQIHGAPTARAVLGSTKT
jgi:hypothetical protein